MQSLVRILTLVAMVPFIVFLPIEHREVGIHRKSNSATCNVFALDHNPINHPIG